MSTSQAWPRRFPTTIAARKVRFLYWLRRLFGLLPPVRWEDGKVVDGATYAAIYAKVVARLRAYRPDLIQTPDFRLTVRIYDRWPAGSEYNWGRVLAPNTIPGDTGGTLCLADFKAHDVPTIEHECVHAITGIGSHPLELFKPDGYTLTF